MPDALDAVVARSSADAGTARAWWLGQNGFAVRGPRGGAILVDPFVSDSISHGYRPYTHERLVPPALALRGEGRLRPDAVLLTHEHADHCDNVFLSGLAAETDCRFVGPPAVGALLAAWDVPDARVTIVAPGARITLPAGEVEVVKAVHVPGAVGYLVRFIDGPTLYFAGDTGLFLGMQALGTAGVDAAFLPINAQYDNLGIDGAVTALAWIRPHLAVPTHYGMFADNTERPERLVVRVAEAGLATRVVVPGHGEEVVIDARG